MVYKLAVVFVVDDIRTVGNYAPRKWALGPALLANTYL